MSNEIKFTKGDWELSFCNSNVSVWCGEELIAAETTFEYPSDEYRDRKIANAHLIKTAPKLYQMLDTVRQVLSGDSEYNADEISVDYINKLLAESRGEE